MEAETFTDEALSLFCHSESAQRRGTCLRSTRRLCRPGRECGRMDYNEKTSGRAHDAPQLFVQRPVKLTSFCTRPFNNASLVGFFSMVSFHLPAADRSNLMWVCRTISVAATMATVAPASNLCG